MSQYKKEKNVLKMSVADCDNKNIVPWSVDQELKFDLSVTEKNLGYK